jgi:O-antigen/teichoic acid export membrane protein
LYTRVLSPADFGALDLFLAFVALAHLTVALEVGQGVARYVGGLAASDRRAVYASSALWFSVACYLLACGVLLLSPASVAERVMGAPGLSVAFRLGVVFVFVSGIATLVLQQFRWELRSREFALTSAAQAVITASVGFLLTYVLRLGIVGLIGGMLAGSVSSLVLGLWRLRGSFRLVVESAALLEMLRFSTPLVLSGIAVWVSLYADRLMIERMLSVESVGVYGIGYRIASVSGLLTIGAQSALTPLVYANERSPETPVQIARIFGWFLPLAATSCVALTLFAPELTALLATAAFDRAAGVIALLVPAVLLSNMYVFAPGIALAKRTRLVVWITVSGGVLNVLLNALLIPSAGILGAATATLVSSGAVLTVYIILGQRFYPIPHRWGWIGTLVLMTATFLYFGTARDWGTSLSGTSRLLALTAFFLLSLGIGSRAGAAGRVVEPAAPRHP